MSTPHSNHLHQFVNSPVLQREQQSQDDKPTKRQKPLQKNICKKCRKGDMGGEWLMVMGGVGWGGRTKAVVYVG